MVRMHKPVSAAAPRSSEQEARLAWGAELACDDEAGHLVAATEVGYGVAGQQAEKTGRWKLMPMLMLKQPLKLLLLLLPMSGKLMLVLVRMQMRMTTRTRMGHCPVDVSPGLHGWPWSVNE